MYRDVTSLDELIKPEEYPKIKAEIDNYFRDFFKKIQNEVNTIVTIDRKGTWILHDFFHENPDVDKFHHLSDNSLNPNYIKNLNILIFDDSIKTGNTIIQTIKDITRFKPKSVQVACLLINNKAFKNIQTKSKISVCYYLRYPTYEEQSTKYILWEIIYLSGLRVRDNPDYPILKLTTTYHDLDILYTYLVDILSSKIIKKFDDFTVDSIANTRNSRTLTIEIDPTDKSILYPFDSIINEIDGYKIRCFIALYGGTTEIKIVPLINPRFDPTNCQIPDKVPNKCFYRIQGLERNEIICKICVPFLVNFSLLEKIQAEIIPEFRKRGIFLNNELRSPEFRRFFRK